MFEKASREKFRYPYKGSVSTEDLWDLSVEELDSIYKTLNKQVKAVNEESLLSTKRKEDATLTSQIDIVKHIFTIKLTEAEERKNAKAKAEQKQKLFAILAQKQEAELYGKTPAEIQAMIDAL